MVATAGLIGLRPTPRDVALITSPPYDVIKKGSELEALLAARDHSLYHVILGDEPAKAFERMRHDGALVPDEEPAYYVYEQSWTNESGKAETRTGVYVAAEVT